MRRFRFRLARVLALRQRQVELSEARLQAQERSAQQSRSEADRLRSASVESSRRPPAGAHIAIEDLAAAEIYSESLRKRAQRKDRDAEHLEAQKRTMLSDHLALQRNVSILESLYHRDLRQHRREQERLVEEEAAETHRSKWLRNSRRNKPTGEAP